MDPTKPILGTPALTQTSTVIHTTRTANNRQPSLRTRGPPTTTTMAIIIIGNTRTRLPTPASIGRTSPLMRN